MSEEQMKSIKNRIAKIELECRILYDELNETVVYPVERTPKNTQGMYDFGGGLVW